LFYSLPTEYLEEFGISNLRPSHPFGIHTAVVMASAGGRRWQSFLQELVMVAGTVSLTVSG